MMKVFVTALRICVAVVLLAVIVLGSLLIYWEYFERTEICAVHDPQQNYTVYIYEIGDAGFPFGSVTTEIVVKQGNWKVLDRCKFELNNDGVGVQESNRLMYAGKLMQLKWL